MDVESWLEVRPALSYCGPTRIQLWSDGALPVGDCTSPSLDIEAVSLVVDEFMAAPLRTLLDNLVSDNKASC